jgi:hypothetical protein
MRSSSRRVHLWHEAHDLLQAVHGDVVPVDAHTACDLAPRDLPAQHVEERSFAAAAGAQDSIQAARRESAADALSPRARSRRQGRRQGCTCRRIGGTDQTRSMMHAGSTPPGMPIDHCAVAGVRRAACAEVTELCVHLRLLGGRLAVTQCLWHSPPAMPGRLRGWPAAWRPC